MSIEELATMLGEQLREAEAKAWDEGWEAAWSPLAPRSLNDGPNPYRKVSA